MEKPLLLQKIGNIPYTDQLSSRAQLAQVFSDLQTTSLISLGQLCDDDCTIVLTKNNVFALKKHEVDFRNQHMEDCVQQALRGDPKTDVPKYIK